MKKLIIVTILAITFSIGSFGQGETSTPMASINMSLKHKNLTDEGVEFVKQREENKPAFIEVKDNVYSKNFHAEKVVESFYPSRSVNYGVFQVFAHLKTPHNITIIVKNEKGEVIDTKKSNEAVTIFEPLFNITQQATGTYFIQMAIGEAIAMQRFVIKH